MKPNSLPKKKKPYSVSYVCGQIGSRREENPEFSTLLRKGEREREKRNSRKKGRNWICCETISSEKEEEEFFVNKSPKGFFFPSLSSSLPACLLSISIFSPFLPPKTLISVKVLPILLHEEKNEVRKKISRIFSPIGGEIPGRLDTLSPINYPHFLLPFLSLLPLPLALEK